MNETGLHRLLQRQLRQLGLGQDTAPDGAAWSRLLERVSRAYQEADDERYLCERSLELSSRELQTTNASLRVSETLLAEERDRLQAIIGSLGDGLCVLDLEGRCVLLNPEGERLLGFREQDLLGQPVLARFCLPEECATAGAKYRDEHTTVRRADGSTFVASVVVDPIVRAGIARGSVLVLRDITALVAAREALEREHRQLQMLIANAPIAMAMLDRSMRYVAHSRQWCVDFAIRGEIVGRHHPDVFPDKRPHWRGIHDRALGGEVVTCSEDRCERADGTNMFLRWTVHPWTTPEGTIGGVVMVTECIDDLVKAREAAIEAARTKAGFLANMSHEIRTPMTAILGFAERLVDADIDAAERSECQAVIRRNGEHLLAIVNDILDLSKIEAGGMVLERAACSPAEVAREVAGGLAKQAQGKGIELAVHAAAGVPERIESDPTRLRQILLNLVGNAIKFTATGSVTVHLRAVSGERPHVAFDVVDTGIGLTPHQQTRLFEPFTQADASTTRRFGGTGLGLAISRRLAQALGGDITIASEPGRGSTFTLTIEAREPAATSAAAPAAPGAEPAPAAAANGTLPPLARRVLLVEDGRDNQRLIGHLLRRAGATVTLADNGAAGLQAALAAEQHAAPFDVVVMDMQMPVMDGYDATRALRAAGFRRPIVALTAHAMSTDRQRCLEAGCTDYLTKPVDRARLLRLLADLTAPVGAPA